MKIIHTKTLHIKLDELSEKLGFDQETLRMIEVVYPKGAGQEPFLKVVLNDGKNTCKICEEI